MTDLDRPSDLAQKSPAQFRDPSHLNRCFCIMPFKEPFNTLYRKVLKPAVRQLKLVPHRADESLQPGEVMKDVWRQIWQARLVVADVTEPNPNVNYELGICHTLGIPTIVTTSLDPKSLPIDYRTLKVLHYDTENRTGYAELLLRAIKEVLQSTPAAVLPWPTEFVPGSAGQQDLHACGVERIFPSGQEVPWEHYASQASHSICIAKLRLDVKEERYWEKSFRTLLARGGTITVCVSDPLADMVRQRYFDERSQHGLAQWSDGLHEQAQLILAMWNCRGRIDGGASRSQFLLKRDLNYPTHAYYSFDGKLLVFGYPHGARGFHSPTTVFNDLRSTPHQFHRRCLQHVVRRSKEMTPTWIKKLSAAIQQGELLDTRVLNSNAEH